MPQRRSRTGISYPIRLCPTTLTEPLRASERVSGVVCTVETPFSDVTTHQIVSGVKPLASKSK